MCVAAALCSDVVRDILRKEKSNWREEGVIDDWQWLLDTLLQMEAWLKSDKLKISHIKRAQRKLRYVMYVIKKVGKRCKGNGLKIMKYHGMVHMAQDILNFGVPMEYDTGSCEQNHKPGLHL